MKNKKNKLHPIIIIKVVRTIIFASIPGNNSAIKPIIATAVIPAKIPIEMSLATFGASMSAFLEKKLFKPI